MSGDFTFTFVCCFHKQKKLHDHCGHTSSIKSLSKKSIDSLGRAEPQLKQSPDKYKVRKSQISFFTNILYYYFNPTHSQNYMHAKCLLQYYVMCFC